MVVYGYVKGNIHAKGLVEIRKNGSVIGNLMTARILIEDGANFKGSIEIDRSAPKESDTNVSSRAASASAGAGSDQAFSKPIPRLCLHPTVISHSMIQPEEWGSY